VKRENKEELFTRNHRMTLVDFRKGKKNDERPALRKENEGFRGVGGKDNRGKGS